MKYLSGGARQCAAFANMVQSRPIVSAGMRGAIDGSLEVQILVSITGRNRRAIIGIPEI